MGELGSLIIGGTLEKFLGGCMGGGLMGGIRPLAGGDLPC